VVDHDTITCLTVPGIGSGLPWAVFVASQRSSEVVTTSYGQPTIFSDADQSSWLTPGGFEVFVNGSNIGAGVIGLDFGIELNGLANDLIVLPLTGLVGGGVVNKNRDPSEKVVQAPDSLKFTMVAGRGQGLTYRLVIRDLLSETTLRSNPITFGYAAPQIGNLVNSIQNDLSALACPVYDPIEHRNVEVSENRDVFVLSLRGFNFGPPRADGKGPLVSAGATRVTPRTVHHWSRAFHPSLCHGNHDIIFPVVVVQILSGAGESTAYSYVVVRAWLTSVVTGQTAVYDVQCFEEWNHDVIRYGQQCPRVVDLRELCTA
jgi:hypothetical protein